MALFIKPQAADTYVDQLQSCRPEILYPNLSVTPPKQKSWKIYWLQLWFDCDSTVTRLTRSR